MKEGPQFVKSIKTKTKFKEIFEKIDNKFWYSVDSTGFFDDDVNDKLRIEEIIIYIDLQK